MLVVIFLSRIFRFVVAQQQSGEYNQQPPFGCTAPQSTTATAYLKM
jgi:hypothetical protein